jgi:hypothetical protein
MINGNLIVIEILNNAEEIYLIKNETFVSSVVADQNSILINALSTVKNGSI